MSVGHEVNDLQASSPDLYVVGPPNGVSCGLTTTCTSTQACCVPPNLMGATCSDTGSCSGGLTLTCDGPEDCNDGKGSPYCCANINIALSAADGGAPMLQGGNASCSASCAASFGQANGALSLTSRLCHAAPDCAGLLAGGVIPFNKCCGNPLAPLKFCGPAALNGQMGLSCQ
jgi:hypothetical protein